MTPEPPRRMDIPNLNASEDEWRKYWNSCSIGDIVSTLEKLIQTDRKKKSIENKSIYIRALECKEALNNQESFQELEGYFDLIINTLSVEIDWNLYLNLLALDGTMVVVGLPEKDTPLRASSLIDARRSLAGSVIGGIRETQEMLNFCSKQNIACDIELIPIQKVNEAYPRVVNSDVRYRFVIDSKSID